MDYYCIVVKPPSTFTAGRDFCGRYLSICQLTIFIHHIPEDPIRFLTLSILMVTGAPYQTVFFSGVIIFQVVMK
jgi:hypothetical protein